MKWRQTPQDIAELTVKQALLLAAAAKLVKRGGRLVYATCSILDEENKEIAEAFLASHPQFRLVPAVDILRKERIDLKMLEYFEVWPHIHGTDGFFAAVFERGA
jgi:16S rRNA (cytosine967-C5)-methyltransferase